MWGESNAMQTKRESAPRVVSPKRTWWPSTWSRIASVASTWPASASSTWTTPRWPPSWRNGPWRGRFHRNPTRACWRGSWRYVLLLLRWKSIQRHHLVNPSGGLNYRLWRLPAVENGFNLKTYQEKTVSAQQLLLGQFSDVCMKHKNRGKGSATVWLNVDWCGRIFQIILY